MDFAADGSAAGRRWVASIPALVEELCAQWGLQLEDARSWHGYNGLVLPVRRGVERCVLKVTWPQEGATVQARALRAWDGQGAVRLLDARPEQGALLLERLDATRVLQALPLLEAAEVAGGLLRRLAIPAPTGFSRLRDLAADIADTLPDRQERLGHPVPKGWLDTARSLARELGASAGDLLIHADLHYGNVLAGTREPWLAIDPKPIAGDPEHAVPELLWTRLNQVDGGAGLRRLLAVLVDSGGLDARLARNWAIVRCVDYWLWGRANGLTEDPLRCRRILEVLA